MKYPQLLLPLMGLFISIPIQAQTDTTKTHLKEVVVEGQTRIVQQDHVSYIPTKRQKNGANSGVGLLYNMMIPQLNVDKLNESIQSTNGRRVSVYKDGAPVGVQDVANLRPKDVLRVEVYENAKDKFPQEEIVVNFVMRQYEYGGYVDLRTDTRFFDENGSYKAMTSFDHKRMNYTVLAGTGYDHDHGDGSEGSETYFLSSPVTRLTSPLSKYSKNDNVYGLFKAVYRGKALSWILQASLIKKTEKENDHTLTSYADSAYPSSDATSDQHTQSLLPNVFAYFRQALSNRQTLQGSFTFNYGRNKYERNYVEGQDWQPSVSKTKEDNYRYDGKLTYAQSFTSNNGFNLYLWGIYEKSSADYTFGNATQQVLQCKDLLFYPTYWHNFAKKLFLSIQAGFDLNSYRINDHNWKTRIWPRPNLTVNYSINKTSSLGFSSEMGTSKPMMSIMNEEEQSVNHFEVLRGNPDLKTRKMLNSMLVYNLYIKNFTMSAFATHNWLIDEPQLYYMAEGDRMVRTYQTGGDYHSLKFGANGTLSMLKKALNINFGLHYYNTILTGLYAQTFRQLVGNLSAFYSVGEFSFTGYFMSPFKGMEETPAIIENFRCNYGLSASWGHKGLFIEAGCRKPFENRPYYKRHFDYGAYKMEQKTFSDALGRQVYVKLSYNFDFGRKVKHVDADINTSSSSGILHP